MPCFGDELDYPLLMAVWLLLLIDKIDSCETCIAIDRYRFQYSSEIGVSSAVDWVRSKLSDIFADTYVIFQSHHYWLRMEGQTTNVDITDAPHQPRQCLNEWKLAVKWTFILSPQHWGVASFLCTDPTSHFWSMDWKLAGIGWTSKQTDPPRSWIDASWLDEFGIKMHSVLRVIAVTNWQNWRFLFLPLVVIQADANLISEVSFLTNVGAIMMECYHHLDLCHWHGGVSNDLWR